MGLQNKNILLYFIRKVKPYLKGSVGVLENFDNHDDVDKIAFDVNEIIRKNT